MSHEKRPYFPISKPEIGNQSLNQRLNHLNRIIDSTEHQFLPRFIQPKWKKWQQYIMPLLNNKMFNNETKCSY